MTTYLSEKIKIISFMLILLVVQLHAYNLDLLFGKNAIILNKGFNWIFQNFFSNGITRIAVPLFFIISGYLFYLQFQPTLENYLDKLKKRFKTLLLPYLIWSIFGVFFYFLLQSIPQSQSFFSNGLIKNYSLNDFFERIFLTPVPYQFWFLRDLMLFVIISPIFYFFIKKLGALLIIILLVTWFINFDFIIISNEAILFFVCGAYLSISNDDLINYEFSKKTYYLICSWIVAVVIKTSLELINFKPLFAINIFLKASILLGILAIWSLYDALKKSNQNKIFFKKSIVETSFFIFALHEPLLTIVKKVCFFMIGKENNKPLIVYIISPIITIIICITVGLILKKYLNKFYSILTGGR